jgi:bifunctional non-homologous end joining protein LigD
MTQDSGRNVVSCIELFFQEGTSDKIYRATLVEGGGVYSVEVEWGRRGGPMNKGMKAVKVPLAKAQKELDKVVREKTNKGYQAITAEVVPAAVAPPVGQGSASRAASSGRARTGQGAQLLNPVEDHMVDTLLDDDDMIAQQKLDGSRVLIHVNDEVIATNRSGQHTQIPAGVKDALAHAPRGTVIDGELVTTTGTKAAACYWAFDLLQHGTEDLRALGYEERYAELDALVEELSGPVKLVPMAVSSKDYRALYTKLQKSRAEGIVFKRKGSPYQAGRPSSGGTQLKYKFIKTADVFLTENAGNAYQMAIFHAGEVREVGKVFAGTTNQSRKLIDELISSGERPVAEVQYLYATDDDILFQPVFVQLRDDKDPEECTLDQLVRTNREVR